MRAGVIGAYAHDRLKLMRELVAVSTRVTHRDPQALEGALAVARAAAFAVGCAGVMDVEGCVRFVVEGLGDEGLRRRVERAGAAAREGISAEAFAGKMGCFGKVTGYMYHTVPAALYAVFCHPGDFCGAVERVIGMGGDTDSTAAIVGGIMGLVAGEGGIPREWVEGVWDWPLGTRGMREAGEMLARGASGEGVRMGWGFWRGVVTMMRTAGVWKVVDVDLDAGEGEGTFGRFVREHPEGGEVGK
jgi:ADP-ribosylglycohydrolase